MTRPWPLLLLLVLSAGPVRAGQRGAGRLGIATLRPEGAPHWGTALVVGRLAGGTEGVALTARHLLPPVEGRGGRLVVPVTLELSGARLPVLRMMHAMPTLDAALVKIRLTPAVDRVRCLAPARVGARPGQPLTLWGFPQSGREPLLAHRSGQVAGHERLAVADGHPFDALVVDRRGGNGWSGGGWIARDAEHRGRPLLYGLHLGELVDGPLAGCSAAVSGELIAETLARDLGGRAIADPRDRRPLRELMANW